MTRHVIISYDVIGVERNSAFLVYLDVLYYTIIRIQFFLFESFNSSSMSMRILPLKHRGLSM